MTTTIPMTKIFLLNRDAIVNVMCGWYGDFERLSQYDRTNNDFIEIVEKSNANRGNNKYIEKDFVKTDDYDTYDFKNNCFYTKNIEVLEIPTEYYEKNWYEIKNKCYGHECQLTHLSGLAPHGSYIFDIDYDEELVLFHEKCRLSKMDPSQKQKIILVCYTFSKYLHMNLLEHLCVNQAVYYREGRDKTVCKTVCDIYEEYISEKAQDGILIPEMTDSELRTNSEFIKWIEDIQLDYTEKNLEDKIINIYRLLYIEKKLDISLFPEIETFYFYGKDRFIELVKDYQEFRFIEWIEWFENNQHLDTISKYQRSLLFKRIFEIGEIDIKILNSNCFFIETSSNRKENVIIDEDKYSLYKYINTGKNILQDTSTNSEKKVELLTEFMSNIVENPLTMLDSLSERADFFPGYGDKYFDALKSWKQSVEEQST